MAQATHTMVESARRLFGAATTSGCSRCCPTCAWERAIGRFLHRRLESTAGIVETVTAEAGLLARLAQQTQAQKAIVRETAMLRVLTNIEVARLGEVGAGFEYLARELDDFATAVAESIAALTAHTAERRTRRSTRRDAP